MKTKSRLLLVFLFIVVSLSTCSNSDAPTLESVYLEIKENGIKKPEIVLAQSIKETGWDYDSWNAKERNNLFGLKGGEKCESNKYGYKIFDHWSESVDYYKQKIQNRYNEGEDYYKFLIRIKYFQSDPDEYISDLKWIVNELFRRGIIK